MSGNIDIRLFGKKPFPPDHIFDSLRKFDPIQINQNVKSNTSGTALNHIDSFFSKVSYLLRQVNSLSWLYDVWREKFFSSGKLFPEDMAMMVILLRMYSHIDTGKRFNDRQDRKDPEVISARNHDHHLGYTGFSLDDFKVFIGTKVVPSRRDLRWFSISGHTRTSKICSWSQSQQYVMRYIKVCLL